MTAVSGQKKSKQELFASVPVKEALFTMAVPTIISQVINLIYNMVDAFFIGRTGNSYMMAATSICLTMVSIDSQNRRAVFTVGVPSAVLTGLFDAANICVNILAAGHNDLVLAAMGIVMKVERVPNAVNIGICQGMLPIVAFNYASGNESRMKETIRTARFAGLSISLLCIVLFELFADPVSRLFLSTSASDAAAALTTVSFAALFLRIRCIASPLQLLNYHTSYCLQAMGKGKQTLLHAFVRELVFYIPLMFILDGLFQEVGLAAALPVGEGLAAVFALYLLHRTIRRV